MSVANLLWLLAGIAVGEVIRSVFLLTLRCREAYLQGRRSRP